jgi:phosphoribosyl-ATP pyrophosphohydrolase/phosphoribosyl-AMP cyclohydrolase/histidinol dehydrogenase
LIALDLLAQAEHDPDARSCLVTNSAELADQVDRQLEIEIMDLVTSDVAARALANGYSLVVASIEEAVVVADREAPEHLSIHLLDAERWANAFGAYGSLFVGGLSTEAHADYGAGPNHVLPTGGGARFQSGLSVMTFLRVPTWLEVADPSCMLSDVATLARHEGLEAHARAVEARAGNAVRGRGR